MGSWDFTTIIETDLHACMTGFPLQLTEYEGQVYFGTLQTPLTGLLTPQAIIGLAKLFPLGGGDLIDTVGDALKFILGK